MKIGALELVVIFIVALLVIGPDKLPQYARKFGNAMREFRKASSDVTQELRESVIDPLEEAQKPLREAMEPLEDLDQSLKADMKSVENDLNSLGKGEKKPSQPPTPAKNTPASSPAPASDAPRAEPTTEENGGDTP